MDQRQLQQLLQQSGARSAGAASPMAAASAGGGGSGRGAGGGGGGSRSSQRVGNDPYITLHWWVEVEGVVSATFAECAGLTMETECNEYRAGGLNTHLLKFPGPTRYGNLVLKRGITSNTALWDWYLEVVRLGQQSSQIRKSITVMLYDFSSQSPVRQWQFVRAFPVKWLGPELRADSGAVAIETLEFAHEGLAQT